MQQQSTGSGALNLHSFQQRQSVKGGTGLGQKLQLLHRFKRGAVNIQDELQIEFSKTLRHSTVHLLIVVRLQRRQGTETTYGRNGPLDQTLKLRFVQLHGNQRLGSLQSLT